MKKVSDKGNDVLVQETQKIFQEIKRENLYRNYFQLIISKKSKSGKIIKYLKGLYIFQLGFERLRFKR